MSDMRGLGGVLLETLRVVRRRQVGQAYTSAVGLLGSADVTVRIGGVQALGALLAEAPSGHDMVVRTLTALVREHAPAHAAGNPGGAPDDEEPDAYERPPGDVRAALVVLARRPRRPEADPIDLSDTRLAGADLTRAWLPGATLFGAELHHADLTGADLTGADLSHSDLRDARLWEARLTRADLSAARLDNAELAGADLRDARVANAGMRGADLHGARLEGATLAESDLSGASLDEAALEGAFLSRANLEAATFDGARMAGTSLLGADLAEADLSAAIGVSATQLADARTDPTTRLPAGL